MSEAEIQIIDQIIEENKENYYCLLKSMLKELKRINNLNSTSGEYLIIERPSFRIKSNKSIFDKTIRKDVDVSKITQFKDILGIRVICLDIIGLDKIYSALKTSTIINVIEEKRWIESADNDGYRGIHLIFTLKDTSSLSNSDIKAEIQIRTVAQHFWASFSHRDIYKTGNILNPHTFERVHQLSDILYQNELEVQRLDLEIKQDPLTINIPRLKSLLDSLMISTSTPELESFYDKLDRYGFLHTCNIPKLQIAITSMSNSFLMNMNEVEIWILWLHHSLGILNPNVLDLKFYRIFAYFNGFFWPKRKIFELFLQERKKDWESIFGSSDPKTLVILLEASINIQVEKFIFTWQDIKGRGMTWDPFIDNRNTTKTLLNLKLIEDVVLDESIESIEDNEGVAKKHRYIIKSTQLGKNIAEEITKKIFKNNKILKSILDDIEIEDYPGKRVIIKASMSMSSIPADVGPTIIENEWWSNQPGYY